LQPDCAQTPLHVRMDAKLLQTLDSHSVPVTRNARAHTIADQFPLATLNNAARGVPRRAGFAPVL